MEKINNILLIFKRSRNKVKSYKLVTTSNFGKSFSNTNNEEEKSSQVEQHPNEETRFQTSYSNH